MQKHKSCSALLCLGLWMLFLPGCEQESAPQPDAPLALEGLTFQERMPLEYANQFTIDRYSDGYFVLQVADGSDYLIIPEGKQAPESLDASISCIYQPADHIYLAATAAMGLFDAIDCCDAIAFSGAKETDWYIESARKAMQNGTMRYAGKYREPDYELLLSNDCTLSIQSTMIEHTPEVKEKLEELGIPVLVDYSSYESHPLGRSEWIKVYGTLMGKQETAQALFQQQTALLHDIEDLEHTDQTAVFFYISNSGQVVTRKSGDYVTKMITLAGGNNVFSDLGDGSATSTVTMEMEEFYSTAKDADYIFYNSTIGGEVHSMEELLSKNHLLSDFRAVQNGNVWCTRNNLFQETMKTGSIIHDFNAILTENTDAQPPQYLFHLESEAAP